MRVSQNEWHLIVLAFDGNVAVFYLDGVLIGDSRFAPGETITINHLQIGGDKPMGRYFRGAIDEVKIYGYALSPSEVKAHYDALKFQPETPKPSPPLTPPITLPQT